MAGAYDPFASHAFHTALEDSGCIGPGTGWEPHHLVLEDDGAVAAILPLYLKSDSFGEFVFDWAWAEAWRRAGLDYYPKLVAATPYSPVGAPKWLVRPGADPELARKALAAGALELAEAIAVSSLHFLFVDEPLAAVLEARGFIMRNDCQFHWHNRGYDSFDAFLARFRASKRSQLKRERRKVAESGLTIRRHGGASIAPDLWDRLHALTARSFMIRGNLPYLNAECYRLLGERLGDALQAFVAWDGDEPVACALCLQGRDVLYGRYWGATREIPGLHFELCYYQGIEHCIVEGIARFEPGAQGEHKLARGFDPVRTVSAHWIAEPSLRGPVADWCARERDAVDSYLRVAEDHLPFRRD